MTADDGRTALALRRAGRREEALAAARRAAGAPGAPAWTAAVLGETLRDLGSRRRGYAETQRALSLDPECRYADALLAELPGAQGAWVLGCRGGCRRAAGALEDAERDLAAAVALDPDAGWLWGWLGEARLRAGKLNEADGALSRAIGLFGEWPEAFMWRGEARRLSGDAAGALRDLDYAVALGYKQYDVFLSRSEARHALGDEDGRLRELRSAVRAAPELFEKRAAELDRRSSRWLRQALSSIEASGGLFQAAGKHIAKNHWPAAQALLSRALRADADNAQACLAMSVVEGALGTGKAAEYCDAAVRLDPSAHTYAERALLNERLGFMEAALRDLTLAVGLSPTAELLERRARLFLGMRHYDLALQDVASALELAPDRPGLHDLRANVSLLLGRVHEAQADVERALRLTPEHVNLRLRLGQILALQGRFAEARRAADALEKTSPAWAGFTRGYVACLEKDWAAAARAFKAAETRALAEDGALAVQAGFYGTVALAFSGLGKGDGKMSDKKGGPARKGKVYLCGLGVYPPQTATVEALRGISECDVIFNNLPGAGISEFLGLFCANRRPVAFRYEQDAKLCADLVLSEVRPGRTVGFVTFGHPLLFGPLSNEVIKRCRKEKIPCKAFAAVSSMDAVLAGSGQVLGYSYSGFQVFETTSKTSLRDIAAANPRLPVVVYFAEGLGGEGILELVKTLAKRYPRGHKTFMFGPKNELWETDRQGFTFPELAKLSHHKLAQSVLFVPPVAA